MIDHDRYRTIKTLEAEFINGIPSWLNDNSTGDATVSTNEYNVGRADLNTGSTSVGDTALLQTGEVFRLYQYDTIAVQASFEARGNTMSDDGVANVWMGFQSSGSYARHQLNWSDADNRHQIAIDDGSSVTLTNTRTFKQDAEAGTSLLLWDTQSETVLNQWYENVHGAEVDDQNWHNAGDFGIEIGIETNDTSVDRRFILFDFKIALMNKR